MNAKEFFNSLEVMVKDTEGIGYCVGKNKHGVGSYMLLYRSDKPYTMKDNERVMVDFYRNTTNIIHYTVTEDYMNEDACILSEDITDWNKRYMPNMVAITAKEALHHLK